MDREALVRSSSRQLAAIADIGSTFDEQGLDYWLFGGWAVDFRVRALTREHGDIDLAVWLRDRDEIHESMRAMGWAGAPVDDEVVAAGYLRHGCLVELTFVVADEEGGVVIPFASGPARWTSTPFGGDRCTLHGVTARAVPLALLMKDKSTPRGDPADEAKDAADLLALSRI